MSGRTLLLGAALVALSVQGQETGKVRLMVDPGAGFQFVLDHKYRLSQRDVELPIGPHHFSFWAPTRKVVDTTITMEPGRMKDFFLRLPYSTDYVAYNKEFTAWRSSRNIQRRVGVVATLGTGVWSIVQYNKWKKAGDQLDVDEALYSTSSVTPELVKLKETDIPQHKQDFKKARNGFYIASGLTAVLAAGTIWTYVRTGKIAPPTYQDSEKVRFDGLVWIAGPDGGQWCSSISIPLAR